MEHRTVVGLPPLPAVEGGSISPLGVKRMRDERGSTVAETSRALALKDHAIKAAKENGFYVDAFESSDGIGGALALR